MEKSEVLPPPDAADRRILTRAPPNAEAALDAFAHLITPAAQRFVRCHYDIPLLGDEHALEIGGALANPLRLSMADLRALPPAVLTVVTECAGNGRATLEPRPQGEAWSDGAVSTAQWAGPPLRSILERAGLGDTAVELVFTGADGGEYQRSLPREVALDADTLLALEMNGAPVPPQFGGPLRLLVPRWYGMASVKWLSRIEAVTRPFTGKYQTEKYVYAPGAQVTRIRIKSMFTSLAGDLRARLPVRLTGLAWGGDGVGRVEIAVDGEWREARLVGPVLPHAWRRFELEWTPPAPGRFVLACRASDERGERQPETPRWNEGGYGANAIQRIEVEVR